MIDPYNITDFSRSRSDLEEFWLFCLAVAGKKATVIADKVAEFLKDAEEGETPFAYVRRLWSESTLRDRLKGVRLGKYALLEKAYSASVADAAPDLTTATAEDLESIPGVGPKTARFFILHSRKDARVAVIDTHVLKYLRMLGHSVPKGVPSGREYKRLEEIMLSEMDKSGMPRAEFDLAVWSHFASNGASPLPGTGTRVS